MQVDADEEDPEGQTIQGSSGSDGLLCVNYLKNNYFQEIGLDPNMLCILSPFLLEIEGSCKFLKSNLS